MVKIVLMAVVEIAKGMLFKIAWQAVGERFFSRLVIYGLEKLNAMTSNEVATETLNDITSSLKGKRLKVIDEYSRK